jgi:hypothetical protein
MGRDERTTRDDEVENSSVEQRSAPHDNPRGGRGEGRRGGTSRTTTQHRQAEAGMLLLYVCQQEAPELIEALLDPRTREASIAALKEALREALARHKGQGPPGA